MLDHLRFCGGDRIEGGINLEYGGCLNEKFILYPMDAPFFKFCPNFSSVLPQIVF